MIELIFFFDAEIRFGLVIHRIALNDYFCLRNALL